LVTGGARGIGAAIANRFARDGHDVTALVRSESTRQAASQSSVRIVEGQLGQLDLSRFIADHGPFDVLVNNAALYPEARLERLDASELRQVFEVNVFAAIELMKLTSAHMTTQRWGRIINITSITVSGGWSGLTAYTGSKGAMIAATRIAARELGPFSVTVNCLAPGAIPTAAEPDGTDDEAVIAKQCLPFRGSVEDIASSAVFLASDEARFITGQTLVVDGGWTMS
jgi:NAD(P)-dependent dehydrogenase (short-subunit alcohol dehydrogenase family)